MKTRFLRTRARTLAPTPSLACSAASAEVCPQPVCGPAVFPGVSIDYVDQK